MDFHGEKQSAKSSKKVARKAVIGVVTNATAAERIVTELKRAGFSNDDVSVLFANAGNTRAFALESNTKAPEGAMVGAGMGGVVGGALGVLAGLGALAIPGIGPLIAAGPIMAGLSGMAAGAAVGGLSGGLVGLGVPEVEAKLYEAKVGAGNVLLSVHVEDAEWRKKAKTILEAGGATDVLFVGETPTAPGDRSARSAGGSEAIAAKIRAEMPVVCSDGKQFAVVDHMEGKSVLKLNRDAQGIHHYIPLSWVTRVDDKVHLDRPGAQAMRDWSRSPTFSAS